MATGFSGGKIRSAFAQKVEKVISELEKQSYGTARGSERVKASTFQRRPIVTTSSIRMRRLGAPLTRSLPRAVLYLGLVRYANPLSQGSTQNSLCKASRKPKPGANSFFQRKLHYFCSGRDQQFVLIVEDHA